VAAIYILSPTSRIEIESRLLDAMQMLSYRRFGMEERSLISITPSAELDKLQ
jgi:hypothetical protein